MNPTPFLFLMSGYFALSLVARFIRYAALPKHHFYNSKRSLAAAIVDYGCMSLSCFLVAIWSK